MSDEFDTYDEFKDLPSNDEKGNTSDLDEYGVWIKKKPTALEEQSSSEILVPTGDSNNMDDKLSIEEDKDEVAFDFDGLAEEKSIEDVTNNNDNSESLDDIDMSDFFTDFENDTNNDMEVKEDEMSLKMDLNFDTMDSYVEDKKEDNFDEMFNEVESTSENQDALQSTNTEATEDIDVNDFLSTSNSSQSSNEEAEIPSSSIENEDIDLNVEVDEAQDLTNISKIEDEESIIIPQSNLDDEKEEDKEEVSKPIVIKNTVVEPENMDEIREENRKILGENEENEKESDNYESSSSEEKSVKNFNDVQALANELTQDTSNLPCDSVIHSGVISVAGLDKVTELLTEMAKELVSIKEEISSLKMNVPHSNESFVSDDIIGSNTHKNDENEDAGFFKDEDTDEAISLTGDELNNILITADFTEDDAKDKNNELTENDETATFSEEKNENNGDVASCEVCEVEATFDDENEFEADKKELDFDDIALENSKLDDFVIPEELDYDMLNRETEAEDIDNSPNTAEGKDMSYLDEKAESIDSDISTDEVSVEIPETQDIDISVKSIDENVDASNKESLSTEEKIIDNAVSSNEDDINVNEDVVKGTSSMEEKEDELPSNIKKDVKSVLSYMDQLLESLPEEKMKEFAESEYFEMYNRLFSELGIS